MEMFVVILSIVTIFSLAMTFIMFSATKNLLKYVAILLEEIAFDKSAEEIYSKIDMTPPTIGHKRNIINEGWEA